VPVWGTPYENFIIIFIFSSFSSENLLDEDDDVAWISG